MGNVIIKEPYYYVIKVDAVSGRQKKTMYKVGETHTNSKRPDALVNKYEKIRANTAKVILFEKLPVRNNKRIRDIQIHAELLKTGKFTKVDEFTVKGAVNEDDGKNEFFETVLTEAEVVDTITEIVESLAKKPINFRYKVSTYNNYYLHFITQKHLVSGELVKVIKQSFPNVKKMLYTPGNTIVLIGQHCPDFVASFAMFNDVIIWHDAADQKHLYEDEELNSKITYIETLEELVNITMNVAPETLLIIANPPYGAPGANIVKTIVDNIEYADFVCLLPVNDYYKNDSKDLYQFVDLTSALALPKNVFPDAKVSPLLVKINKTPQASLSWEDFRIRIFAKGDLVKYFLENSLRNNYAIANATTWLIFAKNPDMKTTLLLEHRLITNKHLAYSKSTYEYMWNKLESIDCAWLAANNNSKSTPGKVNKYVIEFRTPAEKQHIAEFLYSDSGFRFVSKVLSALKVDSTMDLSVFLPNVDWTRPWTVEEILADYGYTQTEIDEVMADLANYQYMED